MQLRKSITLHRLFLRWPSIADHTAVSAPRWTHGPTTDPWTLDSAETLTVEDRVPDGTIAGLARRGHPVKAIGSWQAGGSAQVVAVEAGGVLRGGSDPRGGGLALGR